jgi:hypothetical protein
MSDDERLINLREFANLMAQWVQNAEQRMDTWAGRMDQLAGRMDELAAAHANSEVKIAALADAQIRTEGVVAALGERMAELAAAQAHTDQRLDALIDIVRGIREGNPPQHS